MKKNTAIRIGNDPREVQKPPKKWGHKRADELQARADAETNPAKKTFWTDRIKKLFGGARLRGRMVKPHEGSTRQERREEKAKNRARLKRVRRIHLLSPALQALKFRHEAEIKKEPKEWSVREQEEAGARRDAEARALVVAEERRLIKSGGLLQDRNPSHGD